MAFGIDSETFRGNQDVTLEFRNSACRCTLNQDISTPGIRLKKSVQLTKGDYELVVKASASTKETFFCGYLIQTPKFGLVELCILV